MHVALIEPFYGGSHKQWCDGLKIHSHHDVTIFSLSPHHWKWRMQSGGLALADQILKSDVQIDLILASDFLNLSLFKSLTPTLNHLPHVIYFHENQITYPWSPDDVDPILNRDHTYGMINYISALIADKVLFNSNHHKNSFLDALPPFLKQFPDHINLDSVFQISEKSIVLPLGLNLSVLKKESSVNKENKITFLWNHRWEYDKNPEAFFESLFSLQDDGYDFQLIVLGHQNPQSPNIFEKCKHILRDRILHIGYCESKTEYASWLHLADVIPITSNQDFFGISLVEALYCDVWPLLPPRLAYPEHIPLSNDAHYYEDKADLLQKLKWCCHHVEVVRSTMFRPFVDRYDWSNMITTYDHLLSMGKATSK